MSEKLLEKRRRDNCLACANQTAKSNYKSATISSLLKQSIPWKPAGKPTLSRLLNCVSKGSRLLNKTAFMVAYHCDHDAINPENIVESNFTSPMNSLSIPSKDFSVSTSNNCSYDLNVAPETTDSKDSLNIHLDLKPDSDSFFFSSLINTHLTRLSNECLKSQLNVKQDGVNDLEIAETLVELNVKQDDFNDLEITETLVELNVKQVDLTDLEITETLELNVKQVDLNDLEITETLELNVKQDDFNDLEITETLVELNVKQVDLTDLEITETLELNVKQVDLNDLEITETLELNVKQDDFNDLEITENLSTECLKSQFNVKQDDFNDLEITETIDDRFDDSMELEILESERELLLQRLANLEELELIESLDNDSISSVRSHSLDLESVIETGMPERDLIDTHKELTLVDSCKFQVNLGYSSESVDNSLSEKLLSELKDEQKELLLKLSRLECESTSSVASNTENILQESKVEANLDITQSLKPDTTIFAHQDGDSSKLDILESENILLLAKLEKLDMIENLREISPYYDSSQVLECESTYTVASNSENILQESQIEETLDITQSLELPDTNICEQDDDSSKLDIIESENTLLFERFAKLEKLEKIETLRETSSHSDSSYQVLASFDRIELPDTRLVTESLQLPDPLSDIPAIVEDELNDESNSLFTEKQLSDSESESNDLLLFQSEKLESTGLVSDTEIVLQVFSSKDFSEDLDIDIDQDIDPDSTELDILESENALLIERLTKLEELEEIENLEDASIGSPSIVEGKYPTNQDDEIDSLLAENRLSELEAEHYELLLQLEALESDSATNISHSEINLNENTVYSEVDFEKDTRRDVKSNENTIYSDVELDINSKITHDEIDIAQLEAQRQLLVSQLSILENESNSQENLNKPEMSPQDVSEIHDFLYPVIKLAANPLIKKSNAPYRVQGAIEYTDQGRILSQNESKSNIPLSTDIGYRGWSIRRERLSSISSTVSNSTVPETNSEKERVSWKRSINRRPQIDMKDLKALATAAAVRLKELEASYNLLVNLTQSYSILNSPSSSLKAAKQAYIQIATSILSLGKDIVASWMPISNACLDKVLNKSLRIRLEKIETLSGVLRVIVSQKSVDCYDFDVEGNIVGCGRNVCETIVLALASLESANLV